MPHEIMKYGPVILVIEHHQPGRKVYVQEIKTALIYRGYWK